MRPYKPKKPSKGAIERRQKAVLSLYRSPLLFARMLGADPTPQQALALEALGKDGAHVTVRAGHGVGKTAMAAWAILWFLVTRIQCKVPCTAPSASQLFDNLWAELALWRARLPPMEADRLILHTDRLSHAGNPENRFAVARTARPEAPEALQGFHSPHLLYVVDEASGVDDRVFEVAEGALASPGSRILLIGNPNRADGYFYSTHTRWAEAWQRFCFSCVESRLVPPTYATDMAKRYGADSDVYRVRVLGEFPKASADTLIPIDWITTAVDREIMPADGAGVAGLDVARYGGDTSALVVRHGSVVQWADEWAGNDLMQTVGRVVGAYRMGKFTRVHVDANGMGAGVHDRLREMGVPSVAVNVSESAAYGDRFSRLRDELWWACREWFQSKVCALPPKTPLLDRLTSELSAVRYGFLSSGRLKVESKDEMRARGVASPNVADALVLTFAHGVGESFHTAPPSVEPNREYAW